MSTDTNGHDFCCVSAGASGVQAPSAPSQLCGGTEVDFSNEHGHERTRFLLCVDRRERRAGAVRLPRLHQLHKWGIKVESATQIQRSAAAGRSVCVLPYVYCPMCTAVYVLPYMYCPMPAHSPSTQCESMSN